MNEQIDASLNQIIGLTLEEYKNFKPQTVADKLALALIEDAFEEGGTRAIQIIAERSSGRATAKKDEVKGKGKLEEIMLNQKAAMKL